MSWFKSYFSFLFFRPWKELRHSNWYMVFIALPVISTVLTFVELFIDLHIPLPDWSTETWLILFLLSVICTLLLLIEGLRRYDIRTTNELRKEWDERSKVVEVLSGWIARGEVLYRRCDSVTYQSDTKLEEDITQWHRGAASAVMYDAGLGVNYRDGFYKRSDTGERTPPLNECLAWMHTRIMILKEFRQEFEQPPPQLVYRKDANQIESSL